MISILGRVAILIALAACTLGSIMGIQAGMQKSDKLWGWSRLMAYVSFACVSIAFGLMEYALIFHDFSVSYVAEVGSLSSPLWVRIVSLWSSLEGSILLWAFVLTAYIAAFAFLTKNRYPEHSPWALGVSHAVGVFFCFLVAGIANPFEPISPVPTDGPGPNPLLQNHILMVIHPPALYLGYVGMAVPFGMGAATLFVGKIGAAWSRALRRWMLMPWAFLTIGIILGGWWSYEVLGWGGYWAWDPVENASFLPWLTSTAFIHSAIMMERKDQLRGWAICLLLVSFLLTLLGTFMTRSGVFNSVHSFTQSPIGPVFLVFLAVCSIFSLILLAARMDLLSDSAPNRAGVVSRESAFFLNNLLFSAFTFTVLIGTVYPLLHEATTEKKLSVGAPYFNELSLPICLVIIFLMGVGPALPWGSSSLNKAAKRLTVPLVGAFVGLAFSWLVGARGWMPLLSFFLCSFAFMTTIREFYEPALGRAKKKNESFFRALWEVTRRSRRRFGGYTAHIGILMIAVAVTGSSAFKKQAEFVLKKGEVAAFDGYRLEYRTDRTDTFSHLQARVAEVVVRHGEKELGILEPKLNFYFRMGTSIGTPAVKTSLDEDLYLSLIKIEDDGSLIGLDVIVQPLIFWLWFGGGVMMLGVMISLWPEKKRSKSLPKPKEELA